MLILMIMIKQFWTTLSRYKLASILNISGLSVSFAVLVLVMIQVVTEFSAGRDDPKHENIYRIENKSGKEGDKWHLRMPFKIYEKIEAEIPQVERFAMFTLASSVVAVGDSKYYDVPTIYQGNDLSKVIDYHMIEGTASSSLDDNCAIINESNAIRMFGSALESIGQQIDVSGTKLVVTGVYKDFGKNSMSPNGVVMFGKYGVCSAYFLFKDGADINQITLDVNRYIKESEFADYGGDIKFVALSDTYFDNKFATGDFYRQGNLTITLLLIFVALLIMFIAIINFVNFSMALAPARMRSLNIKGVLGSSKRELQKVIVFEAMMFSVVSFLLSLVWVDLISGTQVANLFKVTELSVDSNIGIVALTGVLALLIGVVSGIYPAIYCTKFTPAIVIKGSFGRSQKGQALRSVLISSQMIISIVLIIVSLFIHLQNRYLTDKNLGYDSENVIVVRGVWDRNAKLMADKIKTLAMINSSASFDGQFGQRKKEADHKIFVGSDTLMLHRYDVDQNFIDLMKIPIVEGRGLLERDRVDSVFNGEYKSPIEIVVSKSAFKALGSSLDSIVRSNDRLYKVVGVTDDVIAHSLYTSGDMTMFVKSDYMTSVVVKVDAKYSEGVLRTIKKIALEVQPYAYTDVEFFSTKIVSLYDKERSLSLLVTIFSLVAVVISLMGILGLVEFDTRYRRREIALRKVYGAALESILIAFNRKFVVLVIVAFLISAPIAWYLVDQWLESFAYRTPIYVWVFLVALIIVQFITISTVTIQSWRAAMDNPIESLKTE